MSYFIKSLMRPWRKGTWSAPLPESLQVLPGVHVAGLVPGVGEVAELANAA